MTEKRKGAKSRVRSIVMPVGTVRSVQMGFSEARWQRIRSVIPHSLDDPAEEALKTAVIRCCNNYMSAVRLLDEGARTAASVRRGGGKQPAPLESLAKHLRSAASVWGQVKGMHDDRLGPLSDFGDRLGALADDAERRLVALRQLKPAKPVDVRKQLICSLAKSCRDLGLRPTRSGRTYEESAPTWFQQFVGTLNDNLLGAQGWGAPDTYTRSALFAEVARAMRGDGK